MNEKTFLISALVVAAALGLVSYFLFDRFMWRKIDIVSLLRKEIHKQGGTMLSVEKTGLFDTGPFSKAEFERASPGSPAVISTVFPRGNKMFHKKIHWKDMDGRRRISWARMDFVPFYRLRKIEWRDDV